MSALAQYSDLHIELSRLSEVEVLREVSKVTAQATAPDKALNMISAIVLRLNGVHALRVENGAAMDDLAVRRLAWRNGPSSGPQGSVVAEIAAGGKRWATLRLQYDSEQLRIADPAAFARFLGQQAGILLERLELERERNLLETKVTRIQDRLATRKIFQRAKSVVAHQRGISEAHAARLLVRYSRQSGQRIKVIADAITFDAYQTARFAARNSINQHTAQPQQHRSSRV